MKRSNKTRNMLFTSVVSLLLCVSMLVGTTFAWFTDKVESGVNTIAAGNLDVELYHADKGTADFTKVGNTTVLFDDVTPNLWEPGALAYENFKIKNEGTLALKYNMNLNVAEESVVNGNKLSDVILVGFKADGFTATTREGMIGEAESWTKLSEFSLNAHGDLLQAQEEKVFGLVLYWQPNANEIDNLYNVKDEALNLKIGVELLATQQMKEEDSFGKDYDEDAWVDGFKVYNAQDLQAAINAGETNIQLENDIDLTESLVIPPAATGYSLRKSAPAPVVLNLNGKTITGTKGRDAENNRVHVLVNNGNLIINGGTIKSAGYDGGSAIYNNAGASLTINDVALYGAPQSDPVYEAGVSKPFPSYAVNNYGNAVVNGATVKSYHGAIATGGDGVTVINDADIDVGLGQSTGITSYAIYSYENAQVTVNGGKFAFTKQEIYVNGGNTFCELGTNPIIINGGNYIGTSFSVGEGREYVISGGTFDKDPSAYAKEGFKAIDNGNGTWTVVFPQESFDSLIENAQPGDTVEVPVGNFTLSGTNDLVIVGNGEDTVLTFTGSIDSANISNATISGEPRLAVKTGQSAVFNNVNFEGTKAWGSVQGTADFVGCTFNGLFHIDSSAATTTIKFEDCTFSETSIIKLGGSAKYILEGCTVEKLAPNVEGVWGKEWLITYCDTTFNSCELGRVIRAGKAITIALNDCVDATGTAVTAAIVHKNADPAVVINGVAQASTSKGLQAALDNANGGTVVLNGDLNFNASETTANSGYGATGITVNGGTLDGNDKSLGINNWGTWDAAVHTTGGTIKNLTINSGMRGIFMGSATADVYIDNVVIDGTVYTFNSDGGSKEYGVYISNSTLNGWTSFSDVHKEVVFTECNFGEGSGYAFCRPYNAAVFSGCVFQEGFRIDARAAIVLEGCYYGDTLITVENIGSLGLISGGADKVTVQ